MALQNTPVLPKTLEFKGEAFGYSFHSALRKLCDSKPTTLMYNIIRLVKSPAWEALYNRVASEVSGKTFTKIDDFARAVRKAWIKYEVYDAEEILKKEFRTMNVVEFFALQTCGELMSQEDWERSLGFLWNSDA